MYLNLDYFGLKVLPIHELWGPSFVKNKVHEPLGIDGCRVQGLGFREV